MVSNDVCIVMSIHIRSVSENRFIRHEAGSHTILNFTIK